MEHRVSLWTVVVLAVLATTAAVQAQGLIEFTAQGDGTTWGSTANWETLPSPDPSVDPSSRFKDPLDPSMIGTNRLPLSTETAFLRNGVTATLSSGTTILNGLYVGGREYRVPPVQSGTVQAESTSTVVMTGGSLCITYGSQWAIRGGSLSNAYGTFAVGDYYDGRFIQQGGTISTDQIDIGRKDPSSTTVPTGYYKLVNGLITNSGTTTLRVRVGYFNVNTLPGGDGTLIIEGGALLPTENTAVGQKPIYVEIAGGTVAAPYRAKGTAIISGGTMRTENWTIGGTNGDGVMTFSGGDIFNSDAIAVAYGNLSNGTLTQTGGSIRTSALRAGYAGNQGESSGLINLNGGTITIASEFALGHGFNNADANSFTGLGVMNVNQTDPNKPTFVDITGTVGDIYLGKGNGKASSGTPAPGVGELNIYAGSFAVSGAATDFILGGYIGDSRPNLQSRGTLNIAGGSFVTTGGIQFTPTGSDTHGVMRVGKDAYCYVNGILSLNGGSVAPSELGRTSKLIMEVSSTKSAIIYLNDVPWLADTLRVETAGDWRPKEGDKFTIMHVYYDPVDYVYYHGSFSTYESNLTLGRQRSDPNDPNSPLLPLWTASTDPSVAREYIARFQGLTNGDANGDHKVDGSDLALMGGAWMKTGQTWGTCEFTGDPNGLVDGSDLALMGGNWMWVKPSPAPGGETALPEPATLALLSLGAVGLIRRRRA
ncbi:MAG: PEP-CTERM sorting domain-containing protein [Phycisphaerae bacterium]|nr:PEP-CTERM sorting domain-containing protein [Phycisphaerae bacterium]